jgi:hypothetical protein
VYTHCWQQSTRTYLQALQLTPETGWKQGHTTDSNNVLLLTPTKYTDRLYMLCNLLARKELARCLLNACID